MTWCEMVHKTTMAFANELLDIKDDARRTDIMEAHRRMNEILNVESLARIATALEKLANCSIEVPVKDFLEE